MTEVELLQLRYLEAEFARIDLLLRREVRKWVLAGQDPNDDYRGMYVTLDEVEAHLQQNFGSNWGSQIALPKAELDYFDQALSTATQQTMTHRDQAKREGVQLRLVHLAETFSLDRTALDILLLTVAPAFDTKYERIYGYLQDNVTRRRPSVRLILDVLGTPATAVYQFADYLQPHAPLFENRLITLTVEPSPANAHWINQTLDPDETITAWLRGYYQPDPLYTDHVVLMNSCNSTVHAALQTVPDVEQDNHGKAPTWLKQLSEAETNNFPLIVLSGVDYEQQQALAHQIAQQFDRPLLQVHLAEIHSEEFSSKAVVKLLLRDAAITQSIPFFVGWDHYLRDDYVDPALLSLLCQHSGPVLVAGQQPWLARGIERQRPIFTLATTLPDVHERLMLWHQYLTTYVEGYGGETTRKRKKAEADGDVALSIPDLAGQFVLSSGQIRDAVLAARDRAQQAQRALHNDDLYDAARRFSNPKLSTLARKIESRYNRTDLVLPPDEMNKLDELVTTVRQRRRVLEVHPKLAPSTGVMVLFAGPPGTGKTMAAEVVATELRLDLYKIDLSSVVSKYIGETEKNLERIFSEAENSNSILFFDEADAIFGKRGEAKDAHDRYANLEVAYLLQRMELYDGVTVLATNLRSNLDEAFARRFFRTIDFPFPKRDERRRIWETIFGPEIKRSKEIDLNWLADRFELAGGNIRNIIYSATIQALDNGGVVTMEYLLHGARRELQKMGRLVHEEDFRQR